MDFTQNLSVELKIIFQKCNFTLFYLRLFKFSIIGNDKNFLAYIWRSVETMLNGHAISRNIETTYSAAQLD
jgi:hypothetical protein